MTVAQAGWHRVGFAVALSLIGVFTADRAADAGPAAYGIEGGVVAARFHSDYGDLLAHDYHTGGAVGASVRFTMLPWLSLQPEVWWIQKGGEGETSITLASGGSILTSTFRYVHSIPYLEMPLLLRLQRPTRGGFEPFVVAGPTLAARVGGDLNIVTISDVTTSSAQRVQRANIFENVGPLGPQYRPWDVGLLGGAGVVVGRGRVRANVEVRYERGFVDLFSASWYLNATNGVISGLAGIEVR